MNKYKLKDKTKKNANCPDGLQASEGEGGGEDSCPRVKKVMIWTELQASARQVTQIATSACGATAIINVLVSTSSAVGRGRQKRLIDLPSLNVVCFSSLQKMSTAFFFLLIPIPASSCSYSTTTITSSLMLSDKGRL